MLKLIVASSILATVAFATPSYAGCNKLVGNYVNAGRVSCIVIADGDQGKRPAVDPKGQTPVKPTKPAA